MPLQEQDHTLIEKYHLKQLTASEQELFEQRLQDVAFKKELDLQGDLKMAFKAEGRKQLKNQLNDFEKKIQKQKVSTTSSPARFSIGRILTIAASLIFLIIAGYWLSNRVPSNDQLFAAYFEDYPNVVAPISKGNNNEDLQTRAFQTYELKQYSEALALISKLPDQDETTAFYKGLCALHLNQAQEAIKHFQTIKNTSLSIYQAGRWYQALALLKLDEKAAAILLLENVRTEGNTERLRKKAADLLEELK